MLRYGTEEESKQRSVTVEADRREHLRARTAVALWYRLPWSRAWQSAVTHDLSAQGLSFKLTQGLCFRGLPVEVAVDVPSAAFRVRGRVLRTHRVTGGQRIVSLSLSSLSGHVRTRVAAFVRRARRQDVFQRSAAFFA